LHVTTQKPTNDIFTKFDTVKLYYNLTPYHKFLIINVQQ